MKKILPAAPILAFSLLAADCRLAEKNQPVDYVDRNTVFSSEKRANPLTLVVEIGTNGRLSLNKIETGTIADPTELAERLKAVFEDREKASIGEREVIVDIKAEVERRDFERLIESLKKARAAPIRVIKPEQ